MIIQRSVSIKFRLHLGKFKSLNCKICETNLFRYIQTYSGIYITFVIQESNGNIVKNKSVILPHLSSIVHTRYKYL